jgi:DNA polymerase (family X)
MTNRDIAAHFEQVADLLEFQDANPFRVRAYRNGARKIANLDESLSSLVTDSDRDLSELDGIGKDLAAKIGTLVSTGGLPMLEELKAEVPPGLLVMIRVSGLGPKKAAALHRELGIDSLQRLRAACENGELQKLKGFGAKTEQTILKGIDVVERAAGRLRWADAEPIVAELLDRMRESPGICQLEVAGSYRRGRETVGDLDLLVEAADAELVMDHLGRFPSVAEILARGKTKMSVRLDCDLQVDLRVVPAESFGAALQYFTGSKEHNVHVRALAKQQGLKINEWGVFNAETSTPDSVRDPTSPHAGALAGRTEKEVYAAIGLPWFPPELREAREEFDWAARDPLPQLITLDDIRADLHMHTSATDGKGTLAEMVAQARVRGLEYIAITDHSKRVTMARGLDSLRLRAQWAEIDRLNEQLEEFRVLKGIECDILERGGMDLPDEVLAEADWVVASIHYGQNQPESQITERILGAVENRYVHAIAHPTGRLIGRRDRYAVDIDQVFVAAARHGKLLELNAHPARLDLDDIHAAQARRHGVPLVISTDAHSPYGLEVMRHGVQQARRAGLSAADVANTLPWKDFQRLLGG